MAALVTMARIDAHTVERAYKNAIRMSRSTGSLAERFGAQAMRAAKARDSMLCAALDRATEVLDKLEEAQRGETRRQSSTAFSERHETPPVAAWKAARETLDKGAPAPQLKWIYVAAAELAGILM